MLAHPLPFAKGHGTGNDFIIVPDPDGVLDLSAAGVAALCDRRLGLGADGVLRVVRTSAAAGMAGAPGPDRPEWFMDHRNADGSLAQMCGNGARVYARYLVQAGLAEGASVAIQTRSGPVVVELDEQSAAVRMPMPRVRGTSSAVLAGTSYPGTVVTCGNPNLVCRVDDPAGLTLASPIELDPAVFAAGANVEFIAAVDTLHVRMRVVERGVGETMSCGSGACAVAAAVLHGAGLAAGNVHVDVPGGRLVITIDESRCVLAGPAVIVATGELSADLLAPAQAG